MKVKNIEFSHIYMYIKHIHTCTYTYMHAHTFIYMGQFPQNCPSKFPCIYNFQTVKAIDFLFSTLHTTPFLYGEIRFGVLQCMIPPLGSNPPNTFRFSCNQIALKIRFVGTEVPVPIVANCVLPYHKAVDKGELGGGGGGGGGGHVPPQIFYRILYSAITCVHAWQSQCQYCADTARGIIKGGF